MTDHSFKPILLDLLHQAHHDQDAFLQELNTAERAATGTPEYWSAKDHVAHMTFWRQHLVLRLQAIIRKAPQPEPESENFEQLNPVIFEEQRHRTWSDVLTESEQAYAELYTAVDQLIEEDLMAFNRFDWLPNGEPPLYAIIMGSSYEHSRDHFAQYYLDRHDLPRATSIYESWTESVVQTEAPEAVKAIVLYNLACFYATHTQVEKASTTLQQALTLAPHLTEWSLSDPDLMALHYEPDEG